MGNGTLRIHFTAADVARTHVAPAPNPFWEMVFSRLRLTEPDPPVALRPWLARVRADRATIAPGARVLAALTPRGPYFPDFVTPSEGGLDAGLLAIMRTPKRRLTDELGKLAEWWPVPWWTRPLGDGEVPTLTRLTKVLRKYHDTAIAPFADLVRPRIAAELALRPRRGEALLQGMAPLMRWRRPVLEMPYGVERDLHLRGRGLLLVPSFFCRHTPVALADAELPPTLVYPIDPRAHLTAGQPLAALLGTTRATILTAIDTGTTTTDLARRAGTSPASASRHTHVLREAGLVRTTREGTAVRHTLTPLGVALLDGAVGG
jgi:DNA-binding transcriptional ArsR family regulator